jgi:hypothetical protein
VVALMLLEPDILRNWRERFELLIVPSVAQPTDADLERLSSAERHELLTLLEQVSAGVPIDTRRPIAACLVDCLMEGTADADDPPAYLEALYRHEQAFYRHVRALERAAGADKTDSERPTVEGYLAALLDRMATARRLAEADGFPLPPKPSPRPIPKEKEDYSL